MSMIKALLESESALKENVNVITVLGELADIQDNCDDFDESIVYTPEAVPVFVMPQGGVDKYVIECDNLFKLMDSQDCGEAAALASIKSVLAGDDPDIKFDDMVIAIKDEDFTHLEEVCKSDKSKIGVRTEQVIKYTNFLKNIQAEGCLLAVDRK